MQKRSRALFLPLVAVGLAVASCGGDDAPDGAADHTGSPAVAEGCPPLEGTDEPVRSFAAAPPMCIDVDGEYRAVVATNLGDYTIELDAEAAPNAVNNFVFLARSRYYDDTPCHRIIPDFMAQCGDPTGTGGGGPGYEFADELPDSSAAYTFGAVAMANAGPDTQGSQFFTITASGGYPLPPDYTVFGRVVDGEDTLEEIDAVGNPNGNGVPPLRPVTIESITIAESPAR